MTAVYEMRRVFGSYCTVRTKSWNDPYLDPYYDPTPGHSTSYSSRESLLPILSHNQMSRVSISTRPLDHQVVNSLIRLIYDLKSRLHQISLLARTNDVRVSICPPPHNFNYTSRFTSAASWRAITDPVPSRLVSLLWGIHVWLLGPP